MGESGQEFSEIVAWRAQLAVGAFFSLFWPFFPPVPSLIRAKHFPVIFAVPPARQHLM